VLLQAFQLVGAALGILSAAFIIYDRLARSRPIFALHVKLGTSRSENHLYVRIVNEVEEDLIVENFRIDPPILGLSEDDQIRSIVAAQLQDVRTLIVPPRGSATYALIILGAATGRDSEPVLISAEWRVTRHPWPWKRSVRIQTSAGELKDLKAARSPCEQTR
jgi:hypothetical protein